MWPFVAVCAKNLTKLDYAFLIDYETRMAYMFNFYRVAEEQINIGLSPFARWSIAFFAALFGIGMILMSSSSGHQLGFIVMGAFCILIALACVTTGDFQQFVGSIIGLSIFIIGILYLYSQVTSGAKIYTGRTEPSVVLSILYIIFIGLPGIRYVIKARFGFKSKNDD